MTAWFLRGRWGGRAAALLAAAVVMVAWVDRGRHLAGGDIGHFVRDRLVAGAASPWGYELTGAGSIGYDVVRLAVEGPFLLLGHLTADWFGQGVYHAAVAAAAAAGVAALVRAVAGASRLRESAVFAVALLAVFNPLTLITFPNPNTMLACAAIGWVVHHLVAVDRPVVHLVLATVPFAYLAVNPPTLVIVAVGVALFGTVATATADTSGTTRTAFVGRVARRLALAAPLVAAAHVWWILPWLRTLFGPTSPIDTAALGVEAWSWSHVNNAPSRVLNLTASWGWSDPLYFPYSARMERFPFGPLSWALPAAAAAGAWQLRRAWPGRVLVLAVVPVWVFATGLHAPFTAVNRLAYEHLPLWWLWREPVTKWGIVLLLLELVLAARAVHWLVELAAARLGGRARRAGLPAWAVPASAATLACATMAAFVWPLWTGAAAPEVRGSLPGLFSAVPQGWRDAAADLNTRDGRVLMLPVPVFYQATTTWGFHGVENVPLQLVARPTVSPVPGGYSASDGDYAALARATQDALVAGDPDAAAALLDKLGVTDVVVRRDVRDTKNQTLSADPDVVAAAVAAAPWAVHRTTTDTAQVHSVARARTGRVSLVGGAVTDTAAAASVVVPGTAVFDRATAPDGLDAVGVVLDGPAPDDVGERLYATLTGPVVVDTTVAGGRLELTPAATPVALPAASTAIGEADLALVGDGDVRRPLPPRVAVPSGGLRVTPARAAAPVDVATAAAGNCNNPDGRDLAADGIAVRVTGDRLRLVGTGGLPCAIVELGDADVVRHVQVDLDSDAGAGVCVHDPAAGVCATRTAMLPGALTRVVAVPPGASQLYLYAATGDGSASATFEQLRFVELDAEVTTDPVVVPHDNSTPTDPSPTGLPDARLGAWSTVENCANTDGLTVQQAGLAAHEDAAGVTLVADRNAACVHRSIEVVPGAGHRVSFTATAVPGTQARACVWSQDQQRCVLTAAETVGGDGVVTLSRVAPVAIDDTDVRLYLYADGDDSARTAPTQVTYTAVSVRPLTGTGWVAGPARQDLPHPAVLDRRPDELALDVPDVPGAVLVLDEAYDPAWSTSGTAVLDGPYEVDGWRTAFVVRAGGTATVRHTTSAAIRHAQVASWLVVAALATVAAAGAARRASRTRRGGASPAATPGAPAHRSTTQPEGHR